MGFPDAIVKMFLQQFDTPWMHSPLYLIFEGQGSQGNISW